MAVPPFDSNPPDTTAKGPLSHLRILDLSRILAGPWATQLLADLGARVIKVESLKGDDTRAWGPPFMEESNGTNGDAAYFTCCNRNKESVCIDFSSAEGIGLVKRLVANADVVVENFKVGGLAKYGLDYASLSADNPGLIYCSVTGFGQTGPYAHRSGYDFLIQGMGGLMSITGHPDGSPGGGPVKVGVAVTDQFTGMYAATSILAALAHRDRTGEGQHIDCSLLDCQVAMLANQGANWLVGGQAPTRMGNNHPNLVPYRVYGVSDGHVIITCGNDQQFARLCDALDLPGLATDPRFARNAGRVDNRAELEALLEQRLACISREVTIRLLENAGVPCGPINEVPEVYADPHVQARGLVVPMTREDGTEITTVGFPAQFSATPASYRSAPPTLGENTQKVLASDLGLEQTEIDQLRIAGVIE